MFSERPGHPDKPVGCPRTLPVCDKGPWAPCSGGTQVSHLLPSGLNSGRGVGAGTSLVGSQLGTGCGCPRAVGLLTPQYPLSLNFSCSDSFWEAAGWTPSGVMQALALPLPACRGPVRSLSLPGPGPSGCAPQGSMQTSVPSHASACPLQAGTVATWPSSCSASAPSKLRVPAGLSALLLPQ